MRRMVAQAKRVLAAKPDWYGATDEIMIYGTNGVTFAITLDDNVLFVRESTYRTLRVNMARSSGNVVAISAKDKISE